MPPKHRDISPFLQLIRDFLLGRKHLPAHRFADGISARGQLGGGLPDTTLHRLSGSQYYLRDARCQVKQPVDLVEEQKRQKAEAAAKAAKEAENSSSSTATSPASTAASTASTASTVNAAKDTKSSQEKLDCKKSTKPKKKQKRPMPTPGKLHAWD
ncbi:hypothetical protein KR222_005461 [Zaprionus bogoriensis]|nr:hypothetical protein KR222_005461 [Zaprionus bogoriensis]